MKAMVRWCRRVCKFWGFTRRREQAEANSLTAGGDRHQPEGASVGSQTAGGLAASVS